MIPETLKCGHCGGSISISTLNNAVVECRYCGSMIDTRSQVALREVLAQEEKIHEKNIEEIAKLRQKAQQDYDTRVYQANELADEAKKYYIIGGIIVVVFFAVFIPLAIAGVIVIVIGGKKSREVAQLKTQAQVQYNNDISIIEKMAQR